MVLLGLLQRLRLTLLIVKDMGMMINRRRVCGGKKLPYDAEIEYLESTGTQWIDTGFKANGGAVVEYKCKFKQYNQILVGSHNPASNNSNGYNRFLFSPITANIVQFNKCTYFDQLEYSSNIDNDYIIYFDAVRYNRLGKINNQVVVNQSTPEILKPINNIVCFLRQYSMVVNAGRLYWLKIQDSEYNLVRDFIPARVGTTGYLYDKVSGQLFGNAGTGSFILGPDK